MYSRKFFFKKPITTVGLLFLFIGIVFISVSLFLSASTENFKKHATEVNGTIEKISADKVFVTFQANGTTVSTRLNYYSSSMRPGDPIALYYDNNDPYIVKTSDSNILNYIFISVGAFMALLGIILLLSQIIKKKQKNILLETGMRINAEIVSIELNMQISSNYRHPFVVECRHQAPDGTVYTYYSGPIWQNPTKYLTSEYIPVYVEPTNPKNYYVDLASVLPAELL